MPQEIDFFSFLHDSEIETDKNVNEDEENFPGKKRGLFSWKISLRVSLS